jgi:hypothetical protein
MLTSVTINTEGFRMNGKGHELCSRTQEFVHFTDQVSLGKRKAKTKQGKFCGLFF